jgi:hypothetical protein
MHHSSVQRRVGTRQVRCCLINGPPPRLSISIFTPNYTQLFPLNQDSRAITPLLLHIRVHSFHDRAWFGLHMRHCVQLWGFVCSSPPPPSPHHQHALGTALQGLEIKSGLCAAVIDDYRRRSQVFLSDFTDGASPCVHAAHHRTATAHILYTSFLGVPILSLSLLLPCLLVLGSPRSHSSPL